MKTLEKQTHLASKYNHFLIENPHPFKKNPMRDSSQMKFSIEPELNVTP